MMKMETKKKKAGSGNNVNHRNSEQNECGNQESGGGEGEEEERRAAEKGKQPMSCKIEPMVREFFDFKHMKMKLIVILMIIGIW